MVPLNVRNYCECPRDIANYEEAALDYSCTWICHHRNETDNDIGLGCSDLIDFGQYYGRPAKELILVKPKEHSKLHSVARRYYNANSKFCTRKYCAPIRISVVYENFRKYGWAPVFAMMFMLHLKYFAIKSAAYSLDYPKYIKTSIEELEIGMRCFDFTNSIGLKDIMKSINILVDIGVLKRINGKYKLEFDIDRENFIPYFDLSFSDQFDDCVNFNNFASEITKTRFNSTRTHDNILFENTSPVNATVHPENTKLIRQ